MYCYFISTFETFWGSLKLLWNLPPSSVSFFFFLLPKFWRNLMKKIRKISQIYTLKKIISQFHFFNLWRKFSGGKKNKCSKAINRHLIFWTKFHFCKNVVTILWGHGFKVEAFLSCREGSLIHFKSWLKKNLSFKHQGSCNIYVVIFTHHSCYIGFLENPYS
jgi:hypothetical protein